MDERREHDGPRIESWLAGWETRAADEAFTANDLWGLLVCVEYNRWLDDELICPKRRVKLTTAERQKLERICCTMIEQMGGRFEAGGIVHTVKDGRIRRSVV